MFYNMFMELIIFLLLFTAFVLFISKYLNYKHKIKISKIFFLIIIINIIFYGGYILFVTIKDIKNNIEFNENIQLYSKDHPDYGLIKEYDTLTDDEKNSYNYYFGDGGRNLFTYIGIPIMCIINIILIIILYYLIDLIILIKNKIYKKE